MSDGIMTGTILYREPLGEENLDDGTTLIYDSDNREDRWIKGDAIELRR